MTEKSHPFVIAEKNLRRLNIRMLEERLCCHRQTIWNWYKNGKFPKPHYLGQNRLWFESEVAAWEQEQMLMIEASANSFYSMSGSSPPNVKSNNGGEV
jgi:predicted DNA-binding transcriptional regulator AlpA